MEKVIFVCLGNICRSPAAEALFKHMCKEKKAKHNLDICSRAITRWNIGDPASYPMREAAKRRGFEIPGKSEAITPEDMETSLYVLAATEEIAEHLKEHAPSEEAKKRVKLICEWSKKYPKADIPDPYQLGEEAFEHVLDMLEESLEGLFSHLKDLGKITNS